MLKKRKFFADDWLLDKGFPNNERLVDISIYLVYPDILTLVDYAPAIRKKMIDRDQKEKLRTLIKTGYFEKYTLNGTMRRPRGIKVKVLYSLLPKIEKLDFVQNIFINHIDGAVKAKPVNVKQLFCVKMTVVIEIEGIGSGFQNIEDRLVLIKAKSSEDAYKKLEKKKDDYSQPYLNSDGRLVRWRIESFDDCYETNIRNVDELNNNDGVEVYSKLRKRKQKKENIWDGIS